MALRAGTIERVWYGFQYVKDDDFSVLSDTKLRCANTMALFASAHISRIYFALAHRRLHMSRWACQRLLMETRATEQVDVGMTSHDIPTRSSRAVDYQMEHKSDIPQVACGLTSRSPDFAL